MSWTDSSSWGGWGCIGGLGSSTIQEWDPALLLFLAFAIPLVVAFGILSTVAANQKPRSKTLPPVGCTFREFIYQRREANLPYWCLDLFRKHQQQQQQQNDFCSVLEVELNFWSRLLVGNRRLFLVYEERTARRILDDSSSTKFLPAFKFLINTTMGMNMIAEPDNGHRWKHVRKSTAPAFSPQNIQLIIRHIEEVVDNWVRTKLEPLIEEGKPVDILAEMNFVTAQVIMKSAFDYVLSEPECREILSYLDVCYEEFGVKSAGNIFRQVDMTRWMYSGIRKGKIAAMHLNNFCAGLLSNYRAQKQKTPHLIIDMIESDEEYSDDNERISDMVGYILAGFDTTANSLSFALMELAQNPQAQEKLRQRLAEFGTKEKEDARSCPELKNVVRESLRMHPVAPGSVRIVGRKDAPVFGSPNIIIPAGSVVFLNYYSIQRNHDVYSDPDKFLPVRWDTPTERMIQSFLPFATGRRGCQGQALAYAELEVVLARVIKSFEFRVANKGTMQAIILHQPVGLSLSVDRTVPKDSKSPPQSHDKEQPFGCGLSTLNKCK